MHLFITFSMYGKGLKRCKIFREEYFEIEEFFDER